MLGAWGDQPLPDIAGIKGFLEDFSSEERVPEWLLKMVDILLEHQELAEVSNAKYRELRY